jgi:2-keto-4-pentenoate hydratase/2-oxohepta-3-ene-1,7-dioic acid hydratase in catechol pathway
MKIVGFASDAGPRLGVVEGDHVIDLQAVDPALPGDLGAVLRRERGDLTPLADLARRAPPSARRALVSLTYALPVAQPGKIVCLGLNYLEHVREGRYADNLPKFPTLFMRSSTPSCRICIRCCGRSLRRRSTTRPSSSP